MKLSIALLAIAVIVLTGVGVFAVDKPSPDALAQQAVSSDSAKSQAAIAALRNEGPAGLEVLLATYSTDIEKHTSVASLTAEDAAQPSADSWDRIRHAIEEVSAQRDCQVSRLYWYTDMDKALAAAKTSGKPILSLRMLGNLNEESGSANSRFFRTTLYSNTEISNYLRENFILYWKSVRPVPVITIDMGDGRKIVRTITGNSIHYILDSTGRPVDALPGLYGPKAFLFEISRAHKIAVAVSNLDDSDFVAALNKYHSKMQISINTAWKADLIAVGAAPLAAKEPVNNVRKAPAAVPAIAAQPLAVSKSGVEMPMVKAMQPATITQLPTDTDEQTWIKIAQRHAEDATLDNATIALIAEKNLDAVQANRITDSKADVESPLVREIANLKHSIAEDTVRNEYLLHSKINEWFIAANAPLQLNSFNERVYAELFLTPSSDPWLGLVPADTFTALDHNGLVDGK